MRQFVPRPRRTCRYLPYPSSLSLIITPIAALLLAAAVPAPSLAQNVNPPPPPAPAELTAGDSTRLIWGPTGRTLKQGEVYVAGYALMLPFVQVGVTDRFSIGAGMPLFAIGSEDPLFWVTPKFRIHRSDRTSVSVGVLHAAVIGEGAAGLAYVVATREAGRGAWTFGAGWAYSSEEGDLRWAGGAPVVQVGGERRLTRRVSLLSENFFAWGGGLFSGAIRLQGTHFVADLGLMVTYAEGEAFGAPVINLGWKF